jgi:hypothetical protein
VIFFMQMAGFILATTILLGAQVKQNHAVDFLARFDKESDPLHKARMMPQYGDLEFREIHNAIEEGDFPRAVEHLKAYRDQVQSLEQLLDAKEADPEKHPTGFKQLQISLRGSLRRLDDLIVRLASDDAKPFQDLRKDLEELDRHVVRELFPRQPGVEAAPPKPKS